MGEIVAACVAGVLNLESAAQFVVARGRLMGQLPRDGKMLAVNATPEQAHEWIRGKEHEVSLAAVNGPASVVVSGSAAAVDDVAQLARAEGRRTTELEVSHAFHSPLMDPIIEDLGQVVASLRISPTQLPLVSNVTGSFLNHDLTGDYWTSHARQPVLFYQGMSKIIDQDCAVVIEVGPHPTLTPAVAAAFDAPNTRWVPTLLRDRQDVSNLLETLGSLFVAGAPLDLDCLFSSPTHHRVSLPLYPFRRDRHWFNTDPAASHQAGVRLQPPEAQVPLHPLLGRVVSLGSHRAVFATSLSATDLWADHRVLGATVFPGTGYLEMAVRGYAAFTRQDWRPVVLRDVELERPLVLAYGKPSKVSITLETAAVNGNDEVAFSIASGGDGDSTVYCRGRISAASKDVDRAAVDTELDRMESKLPVGAFYGELRQGGLEYGSNFATIRELWMGKPDSGEALGRITASLHEEGEKDHPFTLTTLLDGCLQVFGSALRTLDRRDYRRAFVPASIRTVILCRPQLPSQVWSHVSVSTNGDGRAALAHIRVLTDEGDVLAHIDGLELRQKVSLMPLAQGGEFSTNVAQPVSGLGSESRDHLVDRLRGLPDDERVDAVAKWLASEVKDTLGQTAEDLDVDFDNIDPSTALLEIGMDSLLITELQRRIQEKLEFRFQPMQGLDYQSIDSLAKYILDEVLVVESTAGAATTVSAASGE